MRPVRLMTAAFLATVLPASLASATTNLLTNPGAETGDLSGWTVGGNSNPFVSNAGNSLGDNFAPHSGNFDFCAGTGSDGSLAQTVSLLTQGVTADMIDAGSTSAAVSFWERSLPQAAQSDSAQIIVTFLDATGQTLSTVSTPLRDNTSDWGPYAATYPVPAGARSATYTMNFVRFVGSDLDAFIDDNSFFLNGNLPGDANLNGRIDPDDFALTDRGHAAHLTGWTNGDFNNDGTVDSSDYALLATSFAAQSGSYAPAVNFAGPTTAVPEPATLLAPAAFAIAIMSRSRRSSPLVLPDPKM